MRDIAYREARLRLSRIARELTGEQLATRTPGCPAWTVRDVLAHLVGGPADAVAGRPLDITNPAWSQNHVDERKDRSVSEILDEWAGLSPLVEGALTVDDAPPAHHDVLNHEADIRGALGLPRLPEMYGWRASFREIGTRLGGMIQELGTIEFRCGDGETYRAGDGEPLTSAEVPAYEFWRAFFGRRSPAQMRAWDWTGDAEPYIAGLPIFGPATDHVSEPGTAPLPDATDAAIERHFQTFNDAVRNGDFAAFAESMHPDVVLRIRTDTTTAGREAVAAMYREHPPDDTIHRVSAEPADGGAVVEFGWDRGGDGVLFLHWSDGMADDISVVQ